MSGIILTPREISMMSRSVRPAAEEGSQAWGAAQDILGKGWEVFKLEPDTAALWDFTRSRGNPLLDLTENGNDLTLNGDVVRAADGPFGWSYDFPGTDDYLITSDNPASLQIVGELTVEAIVKADAINGRCIISKWDSGDNNRGWLLHWSGAGIEVNISGAGIATDAQATADNATAPVSTALYIAFVYKPSAYLRLFVDGNLVAEDTSNIPSSLFNSNQNVTLGGFWSTAILNNDFNGKIYCVRITPRAKGPGEIWEAGGRLF